MKPPRKYALATAFRVALEDRLKRLAQEENIDHRGRLTPEESGGHQAAVRSLMKMLGTKLAVLLNDVR